MELSPILNISKAPAAASEGDPPLSLWDAGAVSDSGYEDWKYFEGVLCDEQIDLTDDTKNCSLMEQGYHQQQHRLSLCGSKV